MFVLFNSIAIQSFYEVRYNINITLNVQFLHMQFSFPINILI